MIRALPAPSTWDRWQWYRLANLTALGGVVFMAVIVSSVTHGGDAWVYYTADTESPYHVIVGEWGFLYSPVFLLAIQPLQALPWPVFHLLVVAAGIGALVYLIGPRWALAAVVLQAPIISDDLLWANLYLVTAALIVVSLHHPSLWAWSLLTKLTPGVGVLYHVGQRDWRAVRVAVGVTLTLVIISAVILPEAWPAWFDTLRQSSSGAAPLFVPPVLRLIAGAVVAFYAGFSKRQWLMPIGVATAAPQPLGAAIYLLAAWRLRERTSPAA